jgi:hypothetical protein
MTAVKKKDSYSGWANYETWNVALIINNEYKLYLSALDFMKLYKGATPYKSWVEHAGLTEKETVDSVPFISDKLSYAELNQMMKGLNS